MQLGNLLRYGSKKIIVQADIYAVGKSVNAMEMSVTDWQAYGWLFIRAEYAKVARLFLEELLVTEEEGLHAVRYVANS